VEGGDHFGFTILPLAVDMAGEKNRSHYGGRSSERISGAFDTYARPDQELQINYQNADGSGGIVVISCGTKAAGSTITHAPANRRRNNIATMPRQRKTCRAL